jgi:hypothetical protein
VENTAKVNNRGENLDRSRKRRVPRIRVALDPIPRSAFHLRLGRLLSWLDHLGPQIAFPEIAPPEDDWGGNEDRRIGSHDHADYVGKGKVVQNRSAKNPE